MIHATAKVALNASIGPGAVIGAHSVVGPQSIVESYAVIGPYTELGARNHVFSFAAVGGPAQDRRTEPDAPFRLHIGDDNIFREGATISRGTERGHQITRIGHRNLFMAHCHVGHDAVIGNDVTLANTVSLAGHVHIEDGVTFGGHSAVHQFVRIGRLAFVAANAMVSRDVPPFCMAAGDRATLRGLNTTGLKRAGFTNEERLELSRAYRHIFRTVHKSRQDLIQALEPRKESAVGEFVDFIKTSERGILGHNRRGEEETYP